MKIYIINIDFQNFETSEINKMLKPNKIKIIHIYILIYIFKI
jgi:hypothetical protein